MGETTYSFQGEHQGRSRDYQIGRQQAPVYRDDPGFGGTAQDARKQYGLGQVSDRLSQYGGFFGRGQKTLSRRFEKDGKVWHDFRESRADYVISGEIDKLYDVFSAIYDPDLAAQAVGGADIYSYEAFRWSDKEFKMRSESMRLGKDKKTYATLVASEDHRRTVFNNSFFQ